MHIFYDLFLFMWYVHVRMTHMCVEGKEGPLRLEEDFASPRVEVMRGCEPPS